MIEDRGSSVGVSIEEIAQYYPRLYHMAEAETWDSIRKRGLLSTTALLDLFGVTRANRAIIESERRPESVKISHTQYGTIVIRDQKPMRENALLSCLNGMTSRQWYELLNKKVFFWLTKERLTTLLCARAYRDRKHCVITVDTKSMLERHSGKINLSPINSGSTLYIPQPRGLGTFLSLNSYPFDERRKKRGIPNAIAELAVDYAVPDIVGITVRVDHMIGSKVVERLYGR